MNCNKTPLNLLPEDHPLRNQPLSGFWYKNKVSGARKEILPSFKIAQKTFNDLGPAWTDFDEFFKEKPDA